MYSQRTDLPEIIPVGTFQPSLPSLPRQNTFFPLTLHSPCCHMFTFYGYVTVNVPFRSPQIPWSRNKETKSSFLCSTKEQTPDPAYGTSYSLPDTAATSVSVHLSDSRLTKDKKGLFTSKSSHCPAQNGSSTCNHQINGLEFHFIFLIYLNFTAV